MQSRKHKRPEQSNGPVRYVSTSGVRCEDCLHFTPDPINPPAGVGSCNEGYGGWHAGAPHHCRAFEPRNA